MVEEVSSGVAASRVRTLFVPGMSLVVTKMKFASSSGREISSIRPASTEAVTISP
jgi:hypothetical protein